MKMKGTLRVLLAALLSPALFLPVAGSVHAAEDVVPVEAFVSQQTFENPRLSTDGSYVAVSVDLGDDTHGIMVFRLADMSQTAFMKLPKYEMAIEIHWVNDTQLVYVKGGKWGAREAPYDYGEIIAMAHKLRLRVVAEGIETQEQLNFLRRQRCDTGQGYLFDRPIDGRELLERLRGYTVNA